MNPSGKRICRRAVLVAACYLAVSFPGVQAEEIGPQAGQKVAFLGASITAFGYDSNPGGYIHLIEDAFEKAGKKIVIIPAGVGGNNSKAMLARLNRDVLSKKPDWMTLNCGINDVWHVETRLPLDEYKKNITAIVNRATAAGVKVILFTSTMIMEDPANDFNKKLAPYNDFLRSLAKKKHLLLADLNADMRAALAQQQAEVPGMKGNLLTVDGVHPNALGNQMMAVGVLKAMGFSETQLTEFKASWMNLDNAMELTSKISMTPSDYLKLRAMAYKQGRSVDDLIQDTLKKQLPTLLQTSSAPANP